MSRRSVGFIAAICLFGPPSIADNPRVVFYGVVIDRSTSMPIQAASVSIAGSLALQDAVTDSEGYFQLEFRSSVHYGQFVRLTVYKEGYTPYDKQERLSDQDTESHTYPLRSRVPIPSPRSQQPKQEDPSLSVNYLRLFGAQQAPIIFANMYLGHASDDDFSLSSLYRLNTVNYQPPITHFWDTWEYKNANPLRGRAWRELFEGGKGHLALLKAACTGDPVAMEYTKFDHDRYASESCGAAERDEDVCRDSPYSVNQVREALKRRSSEIGFLAIIIENTSGSTLRSLQFHYLEVVKAAPLTLPFEGALAIEYSLRVAQDQQLTLPELKPRASLLWLLAIYHKDEKGFPESYASSVTRPIRVDFSQAGKMKTVMIRKPLLDKAVTVAVPYGWYMQ